MRFGTRFLALCLGLTVLAFSLLKFVSSTPELAQSVFLALCGLALAALSQTALGTSWGRKITTSLAAVSAYVLTAGLFLPAAVNGASLVQALGAVLSAWFLFKMGMALDPLKDRESGAAQWLPSVFTGASAVLLLGRRLLPLIWSGWDLRLLLGDWGAVLLEAGFLIPACVWIAWGWLKRTPRSRVWAPLVSQILMLVSAYSLLPPSGRGFFERDWLSLGAPALVFVFALLSLIFQIQGQRAARG